MYAVTADQHIARITVPAFGRDGDTAIGLAEPTHLAIQVDRVRRRRRQGIGQDGVKIGAVEMKIGKAEFLLALLAQGPRAQGFASLPMAHFARLGRKAHGVQGLRQAKMIEHPGPIGADLHPGADLAQGRGLFQYLDREAGPRQTQRQRQAAKAGAGNNDRPLIFSHGAMLKNGGKKGTGKRL